MKICVPHDLKRILFKDRSEKSHNLLPTAVEFSELVCCNDGLELPSNNSQTKTRALCLTSSSITTPLILASVKSLQQVSAPEEAFPDLLDIIDGDVRKESPDKVQITNSSNNVENENGLLNVLVTVAERVKSMKRRSTNSNFLSLASLSYKDLKCTVNSQKGKHAKRMKVEDERYLQQVNKHRRKEILSHGRTERQGTRKSGRRVSTVKYN